LIFFGLITDFSHVIEMEAFCMSDAVEFWERPTAAQIYMLVGWRQWADAGSISSGLPKYLIQQTKARKIGEIRSDGFYLFQFPGTHGLMRPIIKFEDGYPKSLETKRNELYYTGNDQQGVVILLGDEPHLDIERYTEAVLHIIKSLDIQRTVGLGGVYGELPYDKERTVSCVYSLPQMKEEMSTLAVSFSDYEGGASIGSYVCHHAGQQGIEYANLYAFVPIFNLADLAQVGATIHIENDFSAWLGIMRRVNHLLKTGFDLSDLRQKNEQLRISIDAKIEEIERASPELELRKYFARLSDSYDEQSFDPLDEIWKKELGSLLDDFDPDDQSSQSE
jgi:proteasome assembly chaperone (PAC2) family protein